MQSRVLLVAALFVVLLIAAALPATAQLPAPFGLVSHDVIEGGVNVGRMDLFGDADGKNGTWAFTPADGSPTTTGMYTYSYHAGLNRAYLTFWPEYSAPNWWKFTYISNVGDTNWNEPGHGAGFTDHGNAPWDTSDAGSILQ